MDPFIIIGMFYAKVANNLLEIILPLFGFTVIEIFNGNKSYQFLSENKIYSTSYDYISGSILNSGYFVCKKGFGYIDNHMGMGSIKLITFKFLIPEIMNQYEDIKKITIGGTKYPAIMLAIRRYDVKKRRTNYIMKKIKMDYAPRGEQIGIISEITKFADDNNGNCIAFITGRPGVGKTVIGSILARQLGASLVKSFNPTDKGDYLDNFKDNIISDRYIIIIDEIDALLKRISQDNINSVEDTLVQDKSSWNTFLDDFHLLEKGNILLLISNKSREEIDQMDPSYLREKRVDLFFNFENDSGIDGEKTE